VTDLLHLSGPDTTEHVFQQPLVVSYIKVQQLSTLSQRRIRVLPTTCKCWFSVFWKPNLSKKKQIKPDQPQI